MDARKTLDWGAIRADVLTREIQLKGQNFFEADPVMRPNGWFHGQNTRNLVYRVK
jgi:hypothetical protein